MSSRKSQPSKSHLTTTMDKTMESLNLILKSVYEKALSDMWRTEMRKRALPRSRGLDPLDLLLHGKAVEAGPCIVPCRVTQGRIAIQSHAGQQTIPVPSYSRCSPEHTLDDPGFPDPRND